MDLQLEVEGNPAAMHVQRAEEPTYNTKILGSTCQVVYRSGSAVRGTESRSTACSQLKKDAIS